MYYEQKLTQAEIAKQLGIYRTTISRQLKRIQQQGIVTFAINYDLCETSFLEKQLKEQFNLLEVIVTNNHHHDSTEQKLNQMGLACASYLKKILKTGDVVGFSWGSALAAIAEQLDGNCKKDILCLPMVGGPAGKLDSCYHVNTIVYKIAAKFHAKSLLMDFPAILEEQFLRDAIVKSQHYQQIADRWHQLSVAVFGIGSCDVSDKSIWYGFYGNGDEIKSVTDELAAGDICSRFYNLAGKLIQTTISDNIINISLSKLKLAKYRIGVAQSLEKVDAIIGAIRGEYLNTLVTTKETAQAILDRTLSSG